MTKELNDLLDKLNIQNYSLYSDIYDELIENHVCILKGTNRHPYADEIHAYAEGTPVEYKADGGEWILWREYGKNGEYRIKPLKPSESEFEYQYVLYDKDKEIARSSFLTEHEYDISCLSFEWLMDVKSKRVRS